MNERTETGQEAENRIAGEQIAAEIARKREAGEPLTAEEEASLGVQADIDAQAEIDAEEAARQAAAEGQVVGSDGQTPEAAPDHDPNQENELRYFLDEACTTAVTLEGVSPGSAVYLYTPNPEVGSAQSVRGTVQGGEFVADD